MHKPGNRRHGKNEDQRHAGKQDVQRNFVGCFLTLRPFDQCNHAIEKGVSFGRGDLHHNPVRQDTRSARDGRAVAPGFTDDRCTFAGNRSLVNRGDAFNNLPVGRDQIAGFNQHEITALQLRSGHFAPNLQFGAGHQLRFKVDLHPAQCVGLRFAAAFGNRLCEIGEQQREPEPQIDLE